MARTDARRANARPLRSVLWVPGNRERWMQNAPQLGADGLILDLEDSVPHAEKPAARETVAGMMPALAESGLAIFVRANDLASGLIDADLAAVVGPVAPSPTPSDGSSGRGTSCTSISGISPNSRIG